MLSISTVTTCFNEEKTIGRAINSITKQTSYDEIHKIYIVDDGSTDNSHEVIKELARKEKKISYIYQENSGLAAARNVALNLIDSDLIAFLDGDDYWDEKKLETFVDEIALHPEAGLYYSSYYEIVGESRRLVKPNQFSVGDKNQLYHFLAKGGPIIPSTAVITNKCRNKVGLFNKKFPVAQDAEYWLRICSEMPIHYIDSALTYKVKLINSLGSNRPEKVKYIKLAMEMFIDNNPSLRSAMKIRKSKLERWLGSYHLRNGSYMASLINGASSLSYDITNLKAFKLITVALIRILLSFFYLTKK
ncbi:MAG: glycosyltransferase family 2 protein [Cyclobacteriaceae bacterium]